MIIHGKEYNFLLTVGASAEIAEFCPDGDMARIDELFNQQYAKQMRSIAHIISALSKGYADSVKYETGNEGAVLSVDEILTLSPQEFEKLASEALGAFRASAKQTVETEPSKKKELTESV